jgi:hypothetical protein
MEAHLMISEHNVEKTQSSEKDRKSPEQGNNNKHAINEGF